MLTDEGLRNATGAMNQAAEQIRVSTGSLWEMLDHDRRAREELLARFESACELQAVAVLVQVETLGPVGSAVPLVAKLEALLKKRGVL